MTKVFEMGKLASASIAVLVALLGLVFAIGLLVLLKLELPLPVLLAASGGFALLMVLIQYALGPKLIDWIMTIRWASHYELGQDFGQWMDQTCRTFRIPVPKFGIIEEDSPNAFTYGNGPWNARVVVTRGVINALDPDEFKAVVAHELGHIKHRDFIVMTVVQGLILALYTLYLMARAANKKDYWYVALAAWIAYQLSYYVSLLLSRIREYMADFASAQIMQTGNPLSSALIKISYGIANLQPVPPTSTPASPANSSQWDAAMKDHKDSLTGGYPVDGKKGTVTAAQLNAALAGDRVTPELMYKVQAIQQEADAKSGDTDKKAKEIKGSMGAASLGAFGIAGTAAMRAAVTWLNPSGAVDPDKFIAGAKWELFNPWAKVAEIVSTHPLTARRIQALQALNQRWGAPELYPMKNIQPVKYRGFFTDLFVLLLPFLFLLMAVGIPVALKLGWSPGQLTGLAIAGFSAGCLIKIMLTYPSDFRRSKVMTCLGNAQCSHVNPIPVAIEGVFTGRLDAGVPWAKDFVLQDETGFVACLIRQPFGFLEFLWGWLESHQYIGAKVVVYGWYRRFGTPYLEVDRFEVVGFRKKVKCWHRAWAIVTCFLGLALGIGLWALIGKVF